MIATKNQKTGFFICAYTEHITISNRQKVTKTKTQQKGAGEVHGELVTILVAIFRTILK
jgi:hypothetical protein